MSDFIGGVTARRLPLVLVLLGVESTGLAGALLFACLTAHGPPSFTRLLPGLGAGLAGITALSAFYRALSIGTISIVAPISALGVVVPILVGIAGGDHPGALQLAGILAALIGVVLASREAGEAAAGREQSRRAIGLALVAALGFGSFYVGLRSTARADLLWSLIDARAGVLILAVLALRAARTRPGTFRLTRRDVLVLAGSGLLDLGANGLYGAATRHGLLSLVAVASSLYPVVTVLLARLILRERVRRVQEAGIFAALAGVVLMAAGG